MSVYRKAIDLLTGVVEPDCKEAFQNPESLRHAYHFCVSLHSLRDWVFEDFSSQPGWTCGDDLGAFQKYLERRCPEFAIISDAANSAKHSVLKSPSKTGGVGGADHMALYGSWAISGGPISSAPTLEIVVGDKVYPLLHTAERVLFMWRQLFAENNWG